MTRVFHGPRHRIQISAYRPAAVPAPDSGEPRERPTVRFRVMSLPRGAHPATAFARGTCLYAGWDPDAAWSAVRGLAPRAELPASMEPLVSRATLASICPYCATATQSNHNRLEVEASDGRGGHMLRWAHVPCLPGGYTIDPDLRPRRTDAP